MAGFSLVRSAGVATALAVFAAPAAAQRLSPLPPGTSSISGHVIAGDTGKPIRGALVEIVIYENLSSTFRQFTTEADGRFEFLNLPDGHYKVAASATRYLRMQFGQQQPGPAGLLNPPRTIEIKDGKPFAAADFSLSRFCAIEGVVVDEFGDPVPNAAIQVSQVQYGGGRRRLAPANPSMDVGPIRPTDDRGHFRIGGLAPGTYYVQAMSGAFADPNAAGGFAVTFLPGTTDPSAARAVTVAPGRDTVDADFPLTPAVMATASGTLVGGDGRPISGASLVLMPSERAGTSVTMMVRAAGDDKGRFTFRNLPPGSYTIQAWGRPIAGGGNLNAAPFGYLTFAVDGHDLDQLTLTIPPPRNLRGHISFEGDMSALPKPDNVFVSARPMDFESAPMMGGPSPMKVHDDWTFEVNAMSGLRVVMAGAAPGWIMDRATINGRDVTDVPLDFREHDITDLEIVLTTRASTVTGTVTGADGKPVTDCSVVIFSEDETKWTLWSRYVTFTRPGPQGAFTLKGLPAGSYLAIAAGSLVNGEWQDPEFLRKQLGSAERFSLLDGGSATLTLKLAPKR